ncbi:Diguanylate cyclase [Klebsiella pneumoniae]
MPELHTPANRPGPAAVARVTLLPALLIIVAVAAGCALVSPPVGTRHEILTNPGLYIDLLALLFLVFMLWSSAKVRMSHIASTAYAMGCCCGLPAAPLT